MTESPVAEAEPAPHQRSVVDLRNALVATALEWQDRFGVAPAITSTLSEFDAAMLLGMTAEDYALDCKPRTAVTAGFDFLHRGIRYQVKANRPSGKPGSRVTLVGKANNYNWDVLVWILYDDRYRMVEAWEWQVSDYRAQFENTVRLSPLHMRAGKQLFPG